MRGGPPLTRVLLDARKARDFGIGRYVLGLLGGLARRGEFDLAAVVLPGDAGLLPEGVRPVVSGAGHYTLEELVAVRGAISRAAPDLFHAPHYVVPFFPPRATVVTVHDLMHLGRPEHASPLKRAYATRMIRRAVRLAARVVAVSEATRRDLLAFESRAAGKTRVIPDGVDARFSPDVPAGERDRVRRAHGLEGPFLLFLGNDKPHKNLEGLLAAFGRLGPDLDTRLVLAGGSPARAGARRARAGSLGLSGMVLDLGVVPEEDVPPLLAEARALVLPSFSEGFGLPVLEALAAGTPVACSRRGGLPEAAGEAAVFFDPDDTDAMAAAIRTVLTDDPLRETLRRKGLERVTAFGWDRVAGETAAVYREALSG